MRKIIISLIVLTTLALFAKEQSIELTGEEYELVLENIRIKSIDFVDNNEFVIEHKKSDDVQLEVKNGTVYISSEDDAKVTIDLPGRVNYIYKKDDTVCEFNPDQVIITGNDGEIIEFKDGNMLVIDEDQTRVEIGSEGINVEDQDEKVNISSKGIIVDNDDEYREITGFWGKLLGGFIHAVTKGSMNIVSRHPDKIMKHIINDQDDDTWVFGNSDYEYEDDDIITRDFEAEIIPRKKDKLNVSNRNGGIEIESWDKDFVKVEAKIKTRKGEKEFDKVEINISQEDDILIKTEHLKKNAKVSVFYSIKVPSDLPLAEITSSNGRIDVINCTGNLKLDSSNGGLSLKNHQGDCDLQTSNGTIKVYDVEGDLDCNSSNGKLIINSVEGKVKARTSNGRIELADVTEVTSAYTSNGKIIAELRRVEEDIDLITSNGGIVLYLDPEMDCNLRASTSNSNIEINDLVIETTQISKTSLKGKLGKGGPTIYASTSNAGIDISNIKKSKLM